MRLQAVVLSLLLLAGVVTCGTTKGKDSSQVPRMSKETLKAGLNDSSFVILDVRSSSSWDKSAVKVKGAIREDPDEDTAAWSKRYEKGKTIVLYCS
jgi:hypothetical protein